MAAEHPSHPLRLRQHRLIARQLQRVLSCFLLPLPPQVRRPHSGRHGAWGIAEQIPCRALQSVMISVTWLNQIVASR